MDNEEKKAFIHSDRHPSRFDLRTRLYHLQRCICRQREYIRRVRRSNFVLEDTNGKRIKLSDLKGKGVFLNFWGTWCEPCKREFPYMANQYKHFKSQGVEIVAVNVGESNIAVHNFMKSYGVNFPVVLDTDRQVLNAYDVLRFRQPF